MSLLVVQNVTKSFGSDTLFRNAPETTELTKPAKQSLIQLSRYKSQGPAGAVSKIVSRKG